MAELNDRLLGEVGVEPFYRAFLGERLVDTRGAHFKALCPFHDESNPSFTIDAGHGGWTCFAGCGKGDMVLFFAKARGLDPQLAFKDVARAIEEEFLGGKKAPRKPLAPPPPKEDDTKVYGDLWEEQALAVLDSGPEAPDVPREYGARLVNSGTPTAAVLFPVYLPETNRIVSVKRRYLHPYCLFCKKTATAACEDHPRKKGQEGFVKKSMNMERICLLCSKSTPGYMPALAACFRDHKNETVGFPVGLMGLRALETHRDAIVVVDEGEKDMIALARRCDLTKFVPVSGSSGASSIPRGIKKALRGRRVLLLFDADRSGAIGSGKWARELLGTATSVSRCDLKKAPGGLIDGETRKDVYDYIHAGGDVEALLKWAEEWPVETVPEESRPEDPPPGEDGPDHGKKNGSAVPTQGLTYQCKRIEGDARPVIRLTPEIDLVVDAAEEVLVKSQAQLFKRGREVVQVLRFDRSKRKERLLRPEDAPYIDALDEDTMRDLLARAAKWEKWHKVDEEWFQIPAPVDIARLLLARRRWSFRELDSVVEWPFLRPDGSLCDRPGFDDETGVLYLPSGKFEAVPEKPTREDAVAALVRLAKPFSEFPFANEWDEATVMAAILTIAGRSAIEGPCPAFAVTSSTPGAGKGLLVNLVCSIVMGHEPAVTPWITDEKEWSNLIFSTGKAGDSVVNLDDVDGVLKSGALSAALTARQFKQRIFHSQKTAHVPLRTVWFITGNNFGIRGDLFRRILRIEIDPKVESPEDRLFEHDQILEEVVEQRGQLLPAALTILRAYIREGRPRPKNLPKKGSFGSWDSLVRGAVIWAMGIDPCRGMDKLRDEMTPDLRLMRTLLSCWRECLGEETYTAAQILDHADSKSPTMLPLREALIAFNSKADSLPNSHFLGNVFAKYSGRSFDGIKLTRVGETRNHSATWAAKGPLSPQH